MKNELPQALHTIRKNYPGGIPMMKKLLCVLLCWALLPCFAAPVWAAPVTVPAESAVLMEKETGTVLYAQNEHVPLAPASVTKVMTLLLVMEAIDDGRLSYDDVLTASAYAASMGGSQVYLEAGEQMTVEDLLKAVCVSVLLYITNMVSSNFFSLYVTQRLGLAEDLLAMFPILNAIVMLVFMLGIQHRLDAAKFRVPLWIGLTLYSIAALVLIFSPSGHLGFVLLYVFLGAVASALVGPRKEALLQLNLDPQERARLNALIMASTVAFTSPFGYLTGWLSSIDRRLPFAFACLLFIAAMLVIRTIQEPSVQEQSAPGQGA